MANTEKAIGLVLQAIPYRDHDRIVTLFTEEWGILKLMVHGAGGWRKGLQALTTPLSIGEFLFCRGRGELHTLKEGRCLDTQEPLRASWPLLEGACGCLQALLDSQLTEKPAPLLYRTLTAYLKALPASRDPLALAASFKLKILLHDGLLHPPLACLHCEEKLESSLHMGQEGAYCRKHGENAPLVFEGTSREELLILCLAKSTRVLQKVMMGAGTREKIEKLFVWNIR